MKLYIINLIWSRQCWRPASSVSGRIPAVSSSAWVNGENVCTYQEQIFLKTLQDSKSFPSSFPYALSQQLPGIHTPLNLSAHLGARLLFVSSASKITVLLPLRQGPGPNSPSIWVFLGMGYCKTVFIRPTEGDGQIMQPVEDMAAHLPKCRNRHCKELLYSTIP